MDRKITPQLHIPTASVPQRARPVAEPQATPQPTESAQLNGTVAETTNENPAEKTAESPAQESPRPVAFTPTADTSLEALEPTSAKLTAFEGGYTKSHIKATAVFANRLAEALEGTSLQLSAKEPAT